MKKTDINKAVVVMVDIAADIAERNSGITVTGFKLAHHGGIRWGIEWFQEPNGAQTTYGATLYDAWLVLAHHASGTDVPPF